VRERWTGAIVWMLLGGVILILLLNLNLGGRNASAPNQAGPASPSTNLAPTAGRRPAGFREYPIGEEVQRNQMRIAAVWLPPVQMEGMPDLGSSAMIHLEADIHATEGNRNGFAKDEFVPYLVVNYLIEPQDATGQPHEPIKGQMMPMVARDGLHYGASIEMPKPGRYKLTYSIEPPSRGGLGRHADRVTGVDPWWQPFDVTFDWDYPGPPKPEP